MCCWECRVKETPKDDSLPGFCIRWFVLPEKGGMQLFSPDCPEAPLSQVQVQMLFVMQDSDTHCSVSPPGQRTTTVGHSCCKPFGFCKDRVLCEPCVAPRRLLSQPNLISQDLRTRCSCCFQREWLYGFELSFKTPRLHNSTTLEIVTFCRRATQKELDSSRGCKRARLVDDYCKPKETRRKPFHLWLRVIPLP